MQIIEVHFQRHWKGKPLAPTVVSARSLMTLEKFQRSIVYYLQTTVHTWWPKVSHYHESLLNRIKTRYYGNIFHQLRLQAEHKNIISLY